MGGRRASRRSGGLCFDHPMPGVIGPPGVDGFTRGEVTLPHWTSRRLVDQVWSWDVWLQFEEFLDYSNCTGYVQIIGNEWKINTISLTSPVWEISLFFWSFHQFIPLVRVESFQMDIWKPSFINLMFTTCKFFQSTWISMSLVLDGQGQMVKYSKI